MNSYEATVRLGIDLLDVMDRARKGCPSLTEWQIKAAAEMAGRLTAEQIDKPSAAERFAAPRAFLRKEGA